MDYLELQYLFLGIINAEMATFVVCSWWSMHGYKLVFLVKPILQYMYIFLRLFESMNSRKKVEEGKSTNLTKI